MTTTLAQYTQINDGETIWYADTTELVAALVEVGYTCDAYQGYWAVAEPQHEDDYSKYCEEGAYSALCSRTESVEGDSIPDGTPVETLAYYPYAVGEHRLQCSEALYQAVWAATP